tara:strand:- start:304 stop:606 length:303 start_codon:yes stop_codon:yes gene_type:complete
MMRKLIEHDAFFDSCRGIAEGVFPHTNPSGIVHYYYAETQLKLSCYRSVDVYAENGALCGADLIRYVTYGRQASPLRSHVMECPDCAKLVESARVGASHD